MPSIARRSSEKRSVPSVEQRDDEQRPLVGDPVEDLADLAALPGVPLERVVGQVGSLAVTE